MGYNRKKFLNIKSGKQIKNYRVYCSLKEQQDQKLSHSEGIFQ